MKTLDFNLIRGNRSYPWFKLFLLKVDRNLACQWFDNKPCVAWEDGLGNADYWAVEFECGLQVTFEFFHLGFGGNVLATEPVAQHVGRHLKQLD